MLLDKLRPFNAVDNSVYHGSDDVISKSVHGLEHRSNADEMYHVVDTLTILNFLELENNCSRKF